LNIVCDKALLSAAIDGVSKAVTLRSSIPVLEGILLKAEGFQLTLTGYDLEMGITKTIEANVRETGEIVLSAKLLSDMVHRMPGGDVTIIVADNGKTTIQSGVAQFEIQSISAADFPDLPNTGAEEQTLSMKATEMRDIIDRTLYAVSQDDKKPAHTGELFEILPDKLTVVALDGYRLAIVERSLTASKDIRIIIPAKTMTEVQHLLPDDDNEEVYLFANRRYAVFKTNGYTIMSRLIEGEFLNFRNVLPDGYRTRVTVDCKEFIDTIERASLIITERLKNPLRILFEQGKVTVRCQTSLGKVVDEFSCKMEGEEVEIGFNNRYLLDALRNAACEQVVFEISGPLSPVKILPVNGTDFTYLVLPVRFKND
jgi:DNA polymerase-3 subunit beta